MDPVTPSRPLAGKKIVVVGLGRAGKTAVRLALQAGARVTATDARKADMLADFIEEMGGRVTFELGGHDLDSFLSADLVVTSPGVPWIAELVAAKDAGVSVVDEVELASYFIRSPIVGITGTNGKSTTTVLLGRLLETLGRPVFVGGNLGKALGEAAWHPAALQGIVVAELSSFQLERIDSFHATVSVLTNLSQDHLDRHPSLDDYFAAKAKLFLNQDSKDSAVINGDQTDCAQLVEASPAARYWFRMDQPVDRGAFLDGEQARISLGAGRNAVVDLSHMKLVGRHNRQNALAALTAAGLFGVDFHRAREALDGFAGLAHRMELVCELGGVAFYNDSKATNVGSALGSLSGLDRPFVLIAGGRHKGAPYSPLRPILERNCRALVLMGESAPLMERELSGCCPLRFVSDMDEAVALAASLARPGDAVVLCPATSSYDMFRDYEERGRAFGAAVARLEQGGPS